VASLTGTLYGKTKTLIDFTKLKANGTGVNTSESKTAEELDLTKHDLKQHMPTLVDYSGIAGSNFTQEETDLMKISLSPSNWQVIMNSSASTVENKKYSKCIEWHTKKVNILEPVETDDATPDYDFNAQGDYYTIMGVRVHFPESPFNNWALLKPPFEIPAYDDVWYDYKGDLKADYNDVAKSAAGSPTDTSALKKEDRGTKFLNGYGVIRNVGIIKSITMRVYGVQFKNSISILLKDENDETTEVHMPQYLDFDGWRSITWNNPNYIDDASNRDLYIVPLYPRSEPYIKLTGFRLYRQADQIGGDFVTYIKDVHVTYDEAVLERDDMPIEHEDAWGILEARTTESKKREYSKLGQNQILRYLERQKMDRSQQ
jgi:hypothetical protein